MIKEKEKQNESKKLKSKWADDEEENY